MGYIFQIINARNIHCLEISKRLNGTKLNRRKYFLIANVAIKCFKDRTKDQEPQESDLVMLLAKEKWFRASSFYLFKIHFEILETRHLRFKSQILCTSVCMWYMCLYIILQVHMFMRQADICVCMQNPKDVIGRLSQLLYTLFLEARFLPRLRACCSVQFSSPW